jgi:hypothetical protein
MPLIKGENIGYTTQRFIAGAGTGLESAAVAPSSAASAAIAAIVLAPIAEVVSTAAASILSRRPPVAVPAVVVAAAIRAAGVCRPVSTLLPLLASGRLPPPTARASGAVAAASVGSRTTVAAAAAGVAQAPHSLPAVDFLLSALAAVHILRCDLLQQVEGHLGVHEGPAAAYDGGRFLRVVSRPRDELPAVDDSHRWQHPPQCSLVFVEITQDVREEVSIVELVN